MNKIQRLAALCKMAATPAYSPEEQAMIDKYTRVLGVKGKLVALDRIRLKRQGAIAGQNGGNATFRGGVTADQAETNPMAWGNYAAASQAGEITDGTADQVSPMPQQLFASKTTVTPEGMKLLGEPSPMQAPRPSGGQSPIKSNTIVLPEAEEFL